MRQEAWGDASEGHHDPQIAKQMGKGPSCTDDVKAKRKKPKKLKKAASAATLRPRSLLEPLGPQLRRRQKPKAGEAGTSGPESKLEDREGN